MAHRARSSWIVKMIGGVVLVTVVAIGVHGSAAEAIPYSDHAESSDCRRNHEDREHDDRGHNDRGEDDQSHDHRGRGHGRDNGGHDNPAAPGPGLLQVISVRVPATAFLRVDESGRVTAAATNTGCQPSKQDDVFVFGPDGKIQPTTAFDVDACDWRGDFSVPGRFQPQDCRTRNRREGHDRSQTH